MRISCGAPDEPSVATQTLATVSTTSVRSLHGGMTNPASVNVCAQLRTTRKHSTGPLTMLSSIVSATSFLPSCSPCACNPPSAHPHCTGETNLPKQQRVPRCVDDTLETLPDVCIMMSRVSEARNLILATSTEATKPPSVPPTCGILSKRVSSTPAAQLALPNIFTPCFLKARTRLLPTRWRPASQPSSSWSRN